MSIAECAACPYKLDAPPMLAGKSIICPMCKAMIQIPADTVAEPARKTEAPRSQPQTPIVNPALNLQASPAPNLQARDGYEFEASLLNGTVLGGLLAMGFAVVWFFAAAQFGRYYFYPPVLFAFGIYSVAKGLLRR